MKKLQHYFRLFAELLEKWRWLILSVIGLSLLWVEIQEFLVLKVLNEAFHYIEVAQYAILLISTGLLIELFARSNRAHKRAVKILEYKHRLSLDLTTNDDWESLIQKITEWPGKIAGVDESYLLINDPLSGKFETACHWMDPASSKHGKLWDPYISCEICQERPSGRETAIFHLCRSGDDNLSSRVYSLSISNQSFPMTILKFKLKDYSVLSGEEEEIFRNIGDEILVALRASQDRKRLSEMQSAEVAMAERRTVSTFVHDQLGQNLGYIHLKLDQLSKNDDISRMRTVQAEIKRLREVANTSYEIVRDILKKIQPETVPNLTNLLKEHARTVARRANLRHDFKSIGKTVPLAPALQQSVFFTFCEILSNVEKHASANRVDVLVIWNDNILDISVSDDGVGFDPGKVDQEDHFGLEIIQERIANINGKLMINSSSQAGTVVSISVPLEPIKMVQS